MSKSNKTGKAVLDKIKNQDVKMHSHSYYILLSGFTIISALLVMILTAILMRILLDDLGYIHKGDLLYLGGPGRKSIITNFPWGLTLLSALSVWLTVKMYKKFEISYKHRLTIFYSGLAGALLLTLIVVGQSNVHEPFSRVSRLDRLTTLKQQVEERVYFGKLVEYNEEYLVIELPDGEVIIADITDSVSLGLPRVGQNISFIAEKDESGQLVIEGVRFGRGPGGQVRSMNLMK